ncbi:hypothetical protein KPH14_002682 [Odynerus spinipes]|uniref:Uncharacterized protein n=1 Tax=Odynerus spinipes TaxID=1348599 RepID=A0AAD9R8V3_9HYME|nr:hypothetical protein KPH14_002682 [Odynerus spinipes]
MRSRFQHYPWNPSAVNVPGQEQQVKTRKEWTGNPQDTSLFVLWKRTQIEFEKYSIPAEEPVNDSISPTASLPDNNIQAEDPADVDPIPPISLFDDTIPAEEFLNDDVISAVPILEDDNTTTEQPANDDTI